MATEKIDELSKDRDHALSHDNYGKAATLDGKIDGVKIVLSRIELGHFTINNLILLDPKDNESSSTWNPKL